MDCILLKIACEAVLEAMQSNMRTSDYLRVLVVRISRLADELEKKGE